MRRRMSSSLYTLTVGAALTGLLSLCGFVVSPAQAEAAQGQAAQAAQAATALPDLSVARSGPVTAGVHAPFTETLGVANRGTAAAGAVVISYTPGYPNVVPITVGVTCGAVMRGHSGRGGGFTRVGWTCTAPGLAAGASEHLQLAVQSDRTGPLSEIFGVAPAAGGPQLNQVGHAALAQVNVIVPPVPAAPTLLSGRQVGDLLAVDWTPDPATVGYVTSSLIIATPVGGSNPVLTARVAGSGGGTIGPLQPVTTYSVTVASTDAGGTSPPSAAIQFTTPPSTTPPDAPTAVRTWWTPQLAVSWTPGATGDSPVDLYQVTATNRDGDSPLTFSQTVSTTSAYLTVDDTLDWTVTVRAHNAAGWGPSSVPVLQGGV